MVSTEQLKKEILNYLIENGQHEDMVDISTIFSIKYNLTVDISCLAVGELEKEGKIKRLYHSPVRTGYKVL